MAKSIFLFHGGNYKRGVESGRERVPLNYVEAEQIFIDPEMLSETGTGHGTDLYMSKYASSFCNLAVGDEIFIGTFPDQAIYRAIWAKAYNQVKGFKVEFELVSIKDVYDAYIAGGKDIMAVTGVAKYAGTSTLAYDFTDGQREATKDAIQLAALYGGSYTDYRSNNAHKTELINPPVPLDEADGFYLRMTVIELGEFGSGSDEDSCCSKCGGTKYPSFKAGVILDTTCADKQQVVKYCNCPESLCGEGCGDVDEHDELIPDVTAPIVTDPGDQSDEVDLPITDLQLEADGPVVSWIAAPLPDGLTLDSATGIISGTPTTVGAAITVTVTAVDASGNLSDPVTFDWTITAP